MRRGAPRWIRFGGSTQGLSLRVGRIRSLPRRKTRHRWHAYRLLDERKDRLLYDFELALLYLEVVVAPIGGPIRIKVMAKERKRLNREAKKPKQAPKPAAAAPAGFEKGLSPDIGKSKKT